MCILLPYSVAIESPVMWLEKYSVFMWLVFVVVLHSKGECNAITNAQFNASIRDYAVREESENTTEVKTLQKEYQRYAHFTPMSVPVRFKEIPDSALSPSLSHGRGLLHQNHHGKLGYGLVDYEEGPHSGYGYEYHFPDEHDGHGHFDGHHRPDHHHHVELHHDHHDHHNHHSYHDDHKYGYGHHHKHFDHALAAKTVLWPIAGIALLGAAAALVSNPVLLQLGVVSGKRRRRDTEYMDVTPNISNRNFREFHEKNALTRMNKFNHPNKGKEFKTTTYKDNDDVEKTTPFTRAIKSHKLKSISPKVKKVIRTSAADGSFKYSKEFEDKHYIPIPLKHND